MKKQIKQIIFNCLQPYGFSVDGIKPAGYVSKDDRKYKQAGFSNLRDYFGNKWKGNPQDRCSYYVNKFFENRLTGKEKIIEIGTGAGFITKSIFELFPRIELYSFELDPYLARYLQDEFKNYSFHSMKCNGKDLSPIADQTIDVVIAWGVFTYLNFSNIIKYINEAERVTKKGALFFFDIFDTDLTTPAVISSFEHHCTHGDNRPYVSGKLIEKLMIKRGFALIDSFQENINEIFYSHKFLYNKLF